MGGGGHAGDGRCGKHRCPLTALEGGGVTGMAPWERSAEVEPKQRGGTGGFAIGPKVVVQKQLLQLLIGKFVYINVMELVFLCSLLRL